MTLIQKSILAAVLSAVSIATAATAQPQGFRLYANAFLDSSRTPAARITAEIPFRHLVFLKKEGVFDARYEVYITIRRQESEDPPDTYVLHGFATVRTYEETKKHDLKSRTFRVFSLEPGDYEITGVLRVKHTVIAMQQVVNLHVPDFLSSGIGFGTPSVMMVPSNSSAGFFTARQFRSIVSESDETSDLANAVMHLDRQPAVRFELYLDHPVREPIPCDVYYEVTDPSQDQVLYGKKRVRLTGENDEFVISFAVDNWAPGLYKVNLRALARDPDREATASAEVRIDITRAMLGANFKDTLEILRLIAPEKELAALRDAPLEDRPREWAAFWRRRDPDPETPGNEALQQYLERINFVAREFSKLGPGWRTDRGKVYIKYGPPDQIDSASDDRGQGQYRIWRYFSTNRTFVFYDMFGLGDYKLVEGDLF